MPPIETVLRGLGGHLCPSVTGYLERLIDRQAGLDDRWGSLSVFLRVVRDHGVDGALLAGVVHAFATLPALEHHVADGTIGSTA